MNELPNGWIIAPLKSLLPHDGIFSDGDWIESKDQDPNGSIRLLQLADIGDGYFVDKSSRFVNKEKFAALNCTELKTGDVLIARMPDPLGRACLLPEMPQTCITVVDVAVFRTGKEGPSNKWLMNAINSPQLRAFMETNSSGTTRKRIARGKLAEMELPVPPLNEQKRIADKLDAVLARVNACRDRLDRIPTILKCFRQSVLAAATSGKLTEDWRLNNARSEDWQIVHLSDVASSRLGKMLDKAKNQGIPTPYLRNINVRWFGFDLTDIKQIKVSDEEASELMLRSGDVLICEGGEPGRCAIWAEEYGNYIYQKALHRVRVSTLLMPEWLCYNLKDAADSGHLANLFTGTTIKHLTGIALKKFEFKLPPLDEQTEIVRRVEAMLAYADRLEARYTAARAHVEKLTPATLAKAFRGELVPQDPNDEPASALLDRLLTTKSAEIKAGKRQNKTSTSSGLMPHGQK